MNIPEEITTLTPYKQGISIKNLKIISKDFKYWMDGNILERPYCLCFRFPGHVKANFYYSTNKWTVGTRTFVGEASAFITWYKKQKIKPVVVPKKSMQKIGFWNQLKLFFSKMF